MSTTGFRKIGSATTTPTGSGITIPRGGTGGGGEYGENITNDLRTFAILREPIAYRVVFTVAKAIFDNWFTLEGSNYRTPSTTANAIDDIIEEAKPVSDKPTETKQKESKNKSNEAFNRRVQKQLDKINAKEELTRMAVYERGYGWAIIVLGFNDDSASLMEPAGSTRTLQEIKAYGPSQITVSNSDLDNNPESIRYGLPVYYNISRSGLVGALKVHYTRVIHFATRLIDHDWIGKSVLDAIWDDLTTLRNIRWGLGQTMYRYGSGFPDITFTGAESADIEAWIDSGAFKDLSARTYFVHNEDQVLDFKGLQGRALDPMNYYLPPMEHISCGTGIPLAILRGAQAGALTGSEVNQAEYYGLISQEQSAYEHGIRELITALTGQESDYTFNWLGGFELDEQKKAQIEYTKAQTYDLLWNFQKRNEIRKQIDPELPDLTPEEGGDDLKTKSNGPQPELSVDPLTGLPSQQKQEVDPLTGKIIPAKGVTPPALKPFADQVKGKQLQEQIEQGDASYLITEISKPRKLNAVSS
jgi:hypothetical protein